MPRLSSVLLADGEPRSRATLVYVLEKEQIQVHPAPDAVKALALLDGAVLDLVIVNLDGDEAAGLVRAIRASELAAAHAPILCLGPEAAGGECLAAGATDFLARPAYLRDVLTLARLLATGKGVPPRVWGGELADFGGLFALVRAISAARRTGVMSLIRGLRRGELRFFEGEVTSAQVGTLHGLAALHQLLLWGQARLELRAESVVRRRQIPLSPAELLENGARFLRDFDALARDLTSSSVWEQDLRRIAECVGRIPKEVNPVLRLFDGARSVADVVEDSPYRVIETIRIASRLVEMGALRRLMSPRPRLAVQAALSIEDWRVGTTPPEGVPVHVATAEADTSPSPGARPGTPASALAPAGGDPAGPVEAPRHEEPPAIDWGRLPSAASLLAEPSAFAPVVPSRTTSGEIQAGGGAGRPAAAADGEDTARAGDPLGPFAREGLEVVLDSRQRDALFTDPARLEAILEAALAPAEAPPVEAAVEAPVEAAVEAPVEARPVAVPVAASAPAAEAGSVAAPPPAAEAGSVAAPPPAAEAGSVAAPARAAEAGSVAAPAPTAEAAPVAVPVAAPAEAAPVAVPVAAPAEAPPVAAPARAAEAGSVAAPAEAAPVAVPVAAPAEAGSVAAPAPAAEAGSVAAPAPAAETAPVAAPAVDAAVAAPAPAATPPTAGAAFDDLEQRFFEEERRFAEALAPPVDTFADLDDGRPAPPPSFWRRLFRMGQPERPAAAEGPGDGDGRPKAPARKP